MSRQLDFNQDESKENDLNESLANRLKVLNLSGFLLIFSFACFYVRKHLRKSISNFKRIPDAEETAKKTKSKNKEISELTVEKTEILDENEEKITELKLQNNKIAELQLENIRLTELNVEQIDKIESKNNEISELKLEKIQILVRTIKLIHELESKNNEITELKLRNSQILDENEKKISELKLQNTHEINRLKSMNADLLKAEYQKVAKFEAKFFFESVIIKIASLTIKLDEIKRTAKIQLLDSISESKFEYFNNSLNELLSKVQNDFKEIEALIKKQKSTIGLDFPEFSANFAKLETLNKLNKKEFFEFCSTICKPTNKITLSDCDIKICQIEKIIAGLEGFKQLFKNSTKKMKK